MLPLAHIRICVLLYTSELTYASCQVSTMGRKKAVSTISPKKVNRDTKKGPQFDDDNLTTLFYAIIFNQPEIVKYVLEVNKKINDKIYPKGVVRRLVGTTP